ncbi:MAG: helix-turn-helix domain-containing protein [Dethiobacteria bacterium]|jgi:excisionase family DNA binding protein
MDRYKAEKLYHMIHYFAKWYVPAYYTVPEVARLLRVTPESVTNYIIAGEMKAEKVGGNYRVTVDNLKNFLKLKSGKKLSKTKRRYNVYVV